jgi:hypothetical protein
MIEIRIDETTWPKTDKRLSAQIEEALARLSSAMQARHEAPIKGTPRDCEGRHD